MKLLVFTNEENFGDRINGRLAEKLLPGLFDEDDREQILMVGTMIEPRAPEGIEQILIGAGTGYRRGRPSLRRRTVYAVRGPLTARAMGIDARLACIDPGILYERFHDRAADADVPAVPLFMPHWRTERTTGEGWRRSCATAGIAYCSPTEDPETILRRIRRAPVVITEALHGAVVAESCGVPWVPIVVGPHVLEFKWRDWCASIGIPWAPRRDLPTLRLAPASWSDRGKLLAHRLGIGKDKYRFLRPDADGEGAIDRAAAALSALVERDDAHHRGVARIRDDARDRLLDAFERLRRDRTSPGRRPYGGSELVAAQ